MYLHVNGDNPTYFDSFGVECIRKKIKKLKEDKDVTTNIYRTQAYGSVTCGYFCNGFIYFIIKGKSLLDDTTLLSTNEYEVNDKITLKYFWQCKTRID